MVAPMLPESSRNSYYLVDPEDPGDSDGGVTGDFWGPARTYMDVNLFSNFQLWVPKGTSSIITLPTGKLVDN